VIGLANYGLTFTVDAPYLLQEGVDVDDFPVLVKIPIANTTNLYDAGETADTIYFESEGEILKHELVELTDTYLCAWIKLNLEADSSKVVTLHYGALVDNNYEDKRAVWVNAASVFHFNGSATDTMGVTTATPSANVAFGTQYGTHYQGVYIPTGHKIALVPEVIVATPFSVVYIANIPTVAAKDSYLIGSTSSSDVVNGCYIMYYSTGHLTPRMYHHASASIPSATFTISALPTGDAPLSGLTCIAKTAAGNNVVQYFNLAYYTPSYSYTFTTETFGFGFIGGYGAAACATNMSLSELWIFTDVKSTYWLNAMYRMYNNPDAYIEYGTEVDLDDLTALDIDEADCVANVTKQLGIYDVDFRNIMYEVGDFNATWRLPGTEGITIWGIYQPRPVGDYYFPEMDNLGINDALFFTVTDYLVDIHDKIDIEGVRFDLQAIQVHPIADQKIYKMCVLKRQPEYYATAKGVVS
jgi:hypothetical protein